MKWKCKKGKKHKKSRFEPLVLEGGGGGGRGGGGDRALKNATFSFRFSKSARTHNFFLFYHFFQYLLSKQKIFKIVY